MNPTVTTGAAAAVPHPRRPPAHRSVSLMHSPKNRSPLSRSDSSSDSHERALGQLRSKPVADSPSSMQPLGRNSSGESSNAERWFEKSNNDIQDPSPTFVDNEPPFFMRNSSSSETPPGAPGQFKWAERTDSQSLPLRSGIPRLGTDGSSTEDFRGVIDDLTIQNKKLKRRLKKYEKLHDSHLKDEKLFEVRVHGLPAAKKRELEETLRKFAAGLSNNGSAEFPANGYEGLLPKLNANKAASSQTSFQNADSAYASMSASGRGGSSAAQSGGDSRHGRKFNPSAASKRQNIHSYLHHIPEGLLPHPNPATMTEHARKKVVVRRLEQLFAGKGAANAGHQQPQQQQEVSQMAARADRSAMEVQGQRASGEGKREAQMLKQEGELNQEAPDQTDDDGGLVANVGEQDFANSSPVQSSLEQRPTRPLDLDPHRAQVPSDNIAYFRHLGFSPPYPHDGQAAEDGHGWIYLNILINMAQLHTINVTAEFVRNALSEHSDEFELSPDGRKIRWRGGRATTRTSSNSDSPFSGPSGDDMETRSPRKRPRLSHRSSTRSNINKHLQSNGGATQRSQAENKLVYTPMFHHRDGTDDSDSSSDGEEEATDSPFPLRTAAASSGMTSSGVRTISAAKKRKDRDDDGPIIFYNNARFCTDLSGERAPHTGSNAPPYTKITSHAIGQPQVVRDQAVEKRGDLTSGTNLPEPMDLGDNPIPEFMEVVFPPYSPLKPETSQQFPKKSVDFEVTGIGGVWPADNFAISVQSRHARIDDQAAPETATQSAPRFLPPKFAHMLHGPDGRGKTRAAIHKIHKQVVSSRRKELPPSQLPPALSFMPFMQGSYDDEGSEDEDEDGMSVSPDSDSPGALPPSAAPQAMTLPYTESDDEDDEDADDESEAESDCSLDLLAAARELDPEAIRAREREYDANVAERLAEEIPAGSSAATAGGGSGFASPASGVNREEYRRAMQELRVHAPQRPGLKRAHTDDSMQVHGLEDSDGSSEDSDEEMSDVES